MCAHTTSGQFPARSGRIMGIWGGHRGGPLVQCTGGTPAAECRSAHTGRGLPGCWPWTAVRGQCASGLASSVRDHRHPVRLRERLRQRRRGRGVVPLPGCVPDAVPRLRDGSGAAGRCRVRTGGRNRRMAGGARAVLRGPRRVADRLEHRARDRPGDPVPDHRRAHRQPQLAGETTTGPEPGRVAAAGRRGLRRAVALDLDRPGSGSGRPGGTAPCRRCRPPTGDARRAAAAGVAVGDPLQPHGEHGRPGAQPATAPGAALGSRRDPGRSHRVPRRAA